MTIYRKSGGGNVGLTAVARRSGGAWIQVANIYRRVSGAWVKVWPASTTPLAASLSTTSVSGTGSSSVAIAVGSNACYVSATGGTGSYTYAWQRVSGTAMVLSAATDAATTFAHTVNPNTTVSAVYRCAVSSGGTTVYTGSVRVSLRNEGGA